MLTTALVIAYSVVSLLIGFWSLTVPACRALRTGWLDDLFMVLLVALLWPLGAFVVLLFLLL